MIDTVEVITVAIDLDQVTDRDLADIDRAVAVLRRHSLVEGWGE